MPENGLSVPFSAACACFSMTIAVHFYDTMIAGLFCAAIVIGFCVRFFRPRYFFRLMGAVLLAVVIGVLPMFTAALCGKPMQGSIGWGINILTGQVFLRNKPESGQQRK